MFKSIPVLKHTKIYLALGKLICSYIKNLSIRKKALNIFMKFTGEEEPPHTYIMSHPLAKYKK